MKATEGVIKDEYIETLFAGTNFGHTDYRKLLASSVLKKLVGYHCGYTVEQIMKKARLIGKNGVPTKLGKAFVKVECHGIFSECREG